MKCYKGFDKKLKCRGFQYEIGKEYEEKDAKLCDSGFHACENPLDTFSYYPPADSRYCEVELDDVTKEEDSDSKRCGRRIKIGTELGIKGIVDAFIKLTFDKVDWENSKRTNTGSQSAAIVDGKESIAIATGCHSKAKGAIGCYLVLAEWKEDDELHIVDVKSVKVDGDLIKPNTFYKLENGEFKEVEDDEQKEE